MKKVAHPWGYSLGRRDARSWSRRPRKPIPMPDDEENEDEDGYVLAPSKSKKEVHA